MRRFARDSSWRTTLSPSIAASNWPRQSNALHPRHRKSRKTNIRATSRTQWEPFTPTSMDEASTIRDRRRQILVTPTVHHFVVETSHIAETVRIGMTPPATNASTVATRPTAQMATVQLVGKHARNAAKQAITLECVALESRGLVNRAPHRIASLGTTSTAVWNLLPQSVIRTASVSSGTSNFRLAIAFKNF